MASIKIIDGYIIESGYNTFTGEYKSYINKETYTIEWEWTLKTGYIKKNKPILKKNQRLGGLPAQTGSQHKQTLKED